MTIIMSQTKQESPIDYSSNYKNNEDDNTCSSVSSNKSASNDNNKPAQENESKKRNPKCARCQNHGVYVLVKGHKRKCPFKECVCTSCILTDERRDLMKRTIADKRNRDQDKADNTFSVKEVVLKRQRTEEIIDVESNELNTNGLNHGQISIMSIAKASKELFQDLIKRSFPVSKLEDTLRSRQLLRDSEVKYIFDIYIQVLHEIKEEINGILPDSPPIQGAFRPVPSHGVIQHCVPMKGPLPSSVAPSLPYSYTGNQFSNKIPMFTDANNHIDNTHVNGYEHAPYAQLVQYNLQNPYNQQQSQEILHNQLLVHQTLGCRPSMLSSQYPLTDSTPNSHAAIVNDLRSASFNVNDTNGSNFLSPQAANYLKIMPIKKRKMIASK